MYGNKIDNKEFNKLWEEHFPPPPKSQEEINKICKKCNKDADIAYDDGPGHYRCNKCDHEWRCREWYQYWDRDFKKFPLNNLKIVDDI